jgi:phosphoribosylamine--glycine ligase
MTVILASKGYPGSYTTGSEIKGLDGLNHDGVQIFHAGTRREGGRLLAAGGRVLNVSALGADIAEAQRRVYRCVDQIDWPEGFCRRDIGWRAIARARQ